MADADYCPTCGEPIPASLQNFNQDLLLNVYRTEFRCPECGFTGEVIRHEIGKEEERFIRDQ